MVTLVELVFFSFTVLLVIVGGVCSYPYVLVSLTRDGKTMRTVKLFTLDLEGINCEKQQIAIT